MADNQAIENGETPFTAAADEITSPYTGGTAKAQAVKVLGGAADDNTPAEVGGGTEDGALRVTVASDSTGVLSVDDNGSTLSVDDGGGALTVDGTVAVTHTALTELAGAIDTEVQVDVVGALPAGTNNIGDVDIASIAAGDNNIGNVDVASVPADPFGANADAAVAAGATGSIQAKLRRISSDIDSIKTAVETLDNVVSGSEAQVDLVGSIPAGTNNIGDIDVLTEPALDYSTDQVGAAPATGVILLDRTELTPKFKSVTIAASQTDSEIVALVASKKIRVHELSVTCAATATTLTLESNGTSDTRLDKIAMDAYGGKVLPFSEMGWFETLAGEALIGTTSAGSDVEITLGYTEV